jgi:predicted AlkP superfamily phosphohydrolase/phosphomutase
MSFRATSFDKEPKVPGSFGLAAVTGMVSGAAVGCLAGVIIAAYNPFFVDSIFLGLLFLWAIPAVLGAVVWIAGHALKRLVSEGYPGRRGLRRRHAPLVMLLLALVVAGLYGAGRLNERSPASAADGPRVLIIGIDGATWDIMRPMMERGELPNFQAIRDRGASGVLTSIEPTLSPAVWTTIATGKKRAKHGVMDFTYTQEDLKVPRIWELLEGEGKTVGMQSWLVTWPPAVRNGFMIPGWLARTAETYPQDLHFALDIILGEGLARTPREYLAYIVDAPVIGVRISTLFEAGKLVATSKLKHPPELDLIYRKDMLKARIYADIFCWLLFKHRPDFAANVFYGTDSLAHGYWKFMAALDKFSGAGEDGVPGADHWEVGREDAERYGDVVRDYYRLVDSFIPRMLNLVPENTTVCVLSDHGHGPSEGDWGYLVLKVNKLIQTLGLSDAVSVASVGDWSFLSPAPGAPPENLAGAVETLSAVTVPGKDLPFLVVDMKESATFSLRIAEGVEKSDTFTAPDGTTFEVADFVEDMKLSGTHRLEGVVMLSGNGIKSGYTIRNASLVDITPTLLYVMGSPVGGDMDGSVLTECFEAGHLSENPIRTVESRDNDVPLPGTGNKEDMPDAVRERLRALGYVK